MLNYHVPAIQPCQWYIKGHITLNRWTMGFVSSNMINLHGPLSRIFIGFLLAIIGCVLMIQSPVLSQFAYFLFLIASILVALAVTTLASE